MTGDTVGTTVERILVKLGLKSIEEIKMRNGEYRYMFCPHCGEAIPHRYAVHLPELVESGGMQFDCINCGESGAVVDVHKFEPLVDWGDVKAHGRIAKEERDDDE